MTHYSKEKISQLSEGRGWEHKNGDQALEAHSDTVDTGSLLRIAKAVDGLLPIVKGIREACFREVVSEADNAVHAVIRRWTEQREETHGPIPGGVQVWLWWERLYLLGTTVLSPYQFVGHLGVPEKGTEARKAYDRWMKRKTPKAPKET